MILNNSAFSSKTSFKGFLIAIDGPVGSGKGTIAKALTEKLNAINFYTGGMYRALALKINRLGINWKDDQKIIEILKNSKIELKEKGSGDYSSVFLDGENIDSEIVKPESAMGSSVVGLIKGVREIMVDTQRKMAREALNEGKIVIMEGRDIGTKVLPDADIKIFLTADVAVRALRRLKQLEESGINKDYGEVLSDIQKRDERDTKREIDPLSENPQQYGYYVLDNSKESINETVDRIIDLVKEKGLIKNE